MIAGRGRMWRQSGGDEEVVELEPGLSLGIPTGAHFQFRCDGQDELTILGVTMPPWPGTDEASSVKGIWPPTV